MDPAKSRIFLSLGPVFLIIFGPMLFRGFSFLLLAGFIFLAASCGGGGTAVPDSLRKSDLVYTQNAECMMQCLNISKSEIRALLDSTGYVDMDSSNLKGKCPIYIIKDDNDIKVTVSACDASANILDVKRISVSDTCKCN
jgi:hypothetical protein